MKTFTQNNFNNLPCHFIKYSSIFHKRNRQYKNENKIENKRKMVETGRTDTLNIHVMLMLRA
jgi:hypothetical protein